jgi:O-antigen/teichoic acid export membrane protein
VENLTLGIGGQIRSLSVAATGGLVAAGAIRGAEMLVAPALMVLMGASQVAVPEVAASLRRGPAEFRRLCLAISLGLSGMAVIWGLVVLVLPSRLGTTLLGEVWSGALTLVPGVIVAAAAGCLSVGASAGLRALERADRTMRAQMLVTVIGIVACVGGGVVWGAQGAVWGKALAAIAGGAIWWRHWQLANREREVVRFEVLAVEPLGLEDEASGAARGA